MAVSISTDTPEWFTVLSESQRRIVTHGDENFSNVRLSKALDKRGKALLLPALREAIARTDFSDTSRSYEYEEEEWTIDLHPIRGPETGELFAIQANLRRSDVAPPPRPIVGCWEWDISADGNPSDLAIFWSEGMFPLFDVSTDGYETRQFGWRVPGILFQAIDEDDRARLMQKTLEAIRIRSNALNFVGYEINTLPAHQPSVRRYLRLVGQVFDHPTRTDRLFLRGISYQTTTLVPDLTPDLDDVDARDTSRVIRGVSNELSAAFVDTQSWTVFDETAGWTELLRLPQTPVSLEKIVHPDDVEPVKRFLATVSHNSLIETAPFTARVASGPTWLPVSIRAGGYTTRSGGSHAFCRFSP